MHIKHEQDFFDALKEGPYAWPGGYPVYFIMADGAAMSFKAAQENMREILLAFADFYAPRRSRLVDRRTLDWLPIGLEVNWEDTDLYCAHTNERIPSAYGED